MVNKYNKGTRFEREARLDLEGQGYLVERKNRARWQSNDFWEMFDLIAVKRDGSEIRFVQVKTNSSDFYTARKEVREWKEENDIENIRCEVWLREPRKEWRKEDI